MSNGHKNIRDVSYRGKVYMQTIDNLNEIEFKNKKERKLNV